MSLHAPVAGLAPVAALALQTAALPPLTQPTIVAIAAAYFLAVAAIGVWATRRTRTASDFFVAGQGIGVWVLALSAMAATLSGFAFIGGPGLIYSVGLGAMYIVLPAAVTTSMGAWVLGKRMRLLGEVRGLITVPDAIGARYRSPAAQGLSAIAILIAVVGYMATNLLALGLVVDAVFGTGLGWGIWLGTLVVLTYSAAGGILAGVYTDVFQGSLMAAASVLVFLFTLKVGGGLGGISRTIAAADAAFLGPWGKLPPMAALSFFFVFAMGSLGQPHVVHKFYMLRDPRRLKWYPLLMTVAMLVTLLLYFGVGAAVKALVARGELAPLGSPDEATPTFLLRFTPVVLAGLVFSGVAAAIMSTVNSFMSIGAAAITHDIPLALGRRVRDELRWGRVATVVLSLAAAATAQLSGVLVAFLGIFGWGLFGSTLVPALAIGLNWRGATREGAVASISVGLVLTLLLETLAYFKVFTLPAGVSVSALTLVLSMLAFFGVSWLTRRGAGAAIDDDVRVVMEV
ncbi:MAG: sodium/proline symporter [Gemmatimonadetes bacterium]|nr:sodium/proline symporter [Gemmatimonadota bacterium]